MGMDQIERIVKVLEAESDQLDREAEAKREKTYKIIRFTYGSESRQVKGTGLTLEQAQTHCERDDTHGKGWFDAYTEE